MELQLEKVNLKSMILIQKINKDNNNNNDFCNFCMVNGKAQCRK